MNKSTAEKITPLMRDEVHIHILRTNDEEQIHSPERHLTWLSTGERDQLDSFQSKDRWLEFLWSRLLVRFLLAGYLKKDRHDFEIKVQDRGKPFLAESELKFNLSHTMGYIACSLSWHTVGIDVEKIVTEPRLSRPWPLLAKRFFSSSERDYLFSCAEEMQRKVFYQIFTMKEAYVKALGGGLSHSLTDFSVPLPLERSCWRNFEFLTQAWGNYCLAHVVENSKNILYRYRIFEWDEEALGAALTRRKRERSAWKKKIPMTPLSLVPA